MDHGPSIYSPSISQSRGNITPCFEIMSDSDQSTQPRTPPCPSAVDTLGAPYVGDALLAALRELTEAVDILAERLDELCPVVESST